MFEKINEKILNLKFFKIPIINKIYTKLMNKEIILYLIFGVLTTALNIFIFWIFSTYILNNITNQNLNISISNIIAFIIALIFAFITNKTIVFNAKAENKKKLIYQTISFIIVRLFTFLIDTFGILLLINVFLINKIISKIILNIIVIILNYIFSKLIVFKKKDSNL